MTTKMQRRMFISLLGSAAAAWPLAARGQQKLPTIGFLGSTARWTESPRDAALLERLRELGWIEGRTVAIEHRWAENRMERYAEIATEFVRLRVDVIVTFGTAVPAFKQATSVIPIVFTIDADPVGRGLVASLARPGNNVTGLSAQSTDLVGKRLEILRELLPKRLRLAVMACGGAYRQDSARDETGRHSDRAADQIRPRHQSGDREGARPHCARHAARPRRRGDRMKRRAFITLVGGAGTWPLAAGAQQAVNFPRIGFLGLAGEFGGGEAAAWPLVAGAQQAAMPVVGFLSGASPVE